MSNDHEWLSLIEVSGPFLAVPVLRDVFPQGLEALASGRPQRLRRTYEEWRDAVDMDDLDLPALHAAWIDEVLLTALEMDDTVLRKGATLSDRLTVSMPEHGVTVTPDLAVVNPTNGDEPLLLIHVYEPDTDLDATRRFDGLAITPADRMVALLRPTACPAGIVTNGERWMLVHAPVGTVAGFASWYARLWGQEPETLRAFVSLLGVRRFFGPDEGKLPALYERSLRHQDDVTEALGEQVRRAVEVLVQALDRADQDRNRELLRDVDPRELYEAGLTVMMRLVFLLAAEERALLLLGDPRYDGFYAISSLRMQLRADSEEILERRRSAWSRLLALFRCVYGGIDHPTLRLPALGGSLFDPDRYPFLEGRKKGTSWRSDSAEPLPIDDRTVLLLLEAIQTFEGRTLSYRALDVEQIGHVYEGLLERTVKRVDDVTLELDSGVKAKSPRVTLGEMESARLDGAARVVELLKERSERSESAIRNALERTADDRIASRLLTVCRGDIGLRDRILPFTSLLRTDPWGYPLVHHKGAFVVVLGADRRESGTHYTPKSLTEKIVEETLTPVAYRGPAEGKAPEDWELKSAEELLDLKICDPAMGSGAFLVQACRWLSDRLVEAWSVTEASGKEIDREGRIVQHSIAEGFDPLSQEAEERAIVARRLIAERCLYGVDKNPLAVELAKLSLWLTTMSKGRPFGFLDHNLRSGDSLLGIHDIRQLIELSMAPKGSKQLRLFGRSIQAAVGEAVALRMRLRAIPIRDIGDVDTMAALDGESRQALLLPKLLADAFIGVVLAEARASERKDRLHALEALADAAANEDTAAIDKLRRVAFNDLRVDSPEGQPRRPFHWPIEFPEVFDRARRGFDAIVGNPPFYAGAWITSIMGSAYREHIVACIASGTAGLRGTADLCCYFILRSISIGNVESCSGLILSSSVTEGDSREVGLAQALKSGATIYRATSKMNWPGSANVEIVLAWLKKSGFDGRKYIDEREVPEISAALKGEVALPDPMELRVNRALICKGHELQGDGFKLSPPEAESLVSQNSKNREIIKPLITGDWLNSSNSAPDTYVINFLNMSLSEASLFEGAMRVVEERVKPERMKYTGSTARDKYLREKWWLFRGYRAEFAEFCGQNDRYLALSVVSKYVSFRFVESYYIATAATTCILTSDDAIFAQLQSTLHDVWARYHGSSLGGTLRYIAGRCFRTFPLLEPSVRLRKIGNEYNNWRENALAQNSLGMTEIYNGMHDLEDRSPIAIQMRELQVTLDRVLISEQGWDDVELCHDFHEVPYLPKNDRIRFTISEEARAEVLWRLSELNRLRHFEEVGAGSAPMTSQASVSSWTRSRGAPGQSELGLDTGPQVGLPAAAGSNHATEKIKTFLRTRRSWLSKSDILAYVDIPDGQWNATISDLLARGVVERQGERRGTRYRIVESD
ncbi:Eco57I restriction-modification methylase domain-containing protein [Bauldia litoralis]|uniref:site-specific DNA-methyltransferase (adenine-specific) n=1 Tax=Bauldia litoralis TaxID=665467 RepID=A0A1G6EKC3_9HYPH|nr:type IIL restriction-modification enzyme MmeI [Bauldia litoralis]SDB57828.1 hypothetical protein SAMN02982931_04620 [Bauldia litoralis]